MPWYSDNDTGIQVFVAPELEGVRDATLVRDADETDEDFARREMTYAALMDLIERARRRDDQKISE